MAAITQLKKGNNNVYPLTHIDGVVDDNGNSIKSSYSKKIETAYSIEYDTSLKNLYLLNNAGDRLPGYVDATQFNFLNEIDSITTLESNVSGGNNVITITDTDGVSTSFNVKNGVDGVSLGQISLTNTTGNGTDVVMSQKAVTDNIERLTIDEMSVIAEGYDFTLPDGYTELKWISNENGASSIDTGLIPDDNAWRFVGSWARRNGTISGTYNRLFAAAYSQGAGTMGYAIRRWNNNNDKVWITGWSRISDQGTQITIDGSVNIWHTFDLFKNYVILDGTKYGAGTFTVNSYDHTTTFKLSDPNYPIAFGRFIAWHNNRCVGCFIPCINDSNVVGVYDVVSKTFITSTNGTNYVAGDAVDINTNNKLANAADISRIIKLPLQELGDSLYDTVSQKTITDEMNFISNKGSIPSYFTGVLAAFNLDNYPTLDIRKCDGISLVMDMYSSIDGRSMAFFGISNTNNDANALCYFIRNHWNVHGVGLFNSYGGTLVNGVTLNIPQSELAATHRVFTIDFRTGECKIYRNGVFSRTLTPSTYDYNALLNFFNTTGKKLWLGTGSVYGGYKISAMSLFGHVLSDDDIADIYGDGSDSVRGKLLKDKWLANWAVPHIITNWALQSTNVTITDNTNGGGKICTVNAANVEYCRFGFTGIPLSGENAVRNNIIYEWDFEILSGSATLNYSMGNNGQNFKTWYVIDEQNNTLADGSVVSTGQTYHVINKPNNLRGGLWDSSGSSLHLGYVFNAPSSDFSIWIKPDLKLTERGSALVFSTDTYRGDYWEMPSGIRIPNTRENLYNMMGNTTGQIRQKVYYDIFKPSTIIYSNNIPVQFNGQTAVDTTNGKIYIGYVTGTGGTWKQINNS